MPLLGGDRRASRAELRKLALYAHGQERIELDDMMAVVADASALGSTRWSMRPSPAGSREVEKEFSKAMIAGTAPVAIVGAALRQIERLHALRLRSRAARRRRRWSSRCSRRFTSAASRWSRSALQDWTSERLAKAMAMLAEASLEARLHAGLAETIAQRAMTLMARAAARRE